MILVVDAQETIMPMIISEITDGMVVILAQQMMIIKCSLYIKLIQLISNYHKHHVLDILHVMSYLHRYQFLNLLFYFDKNYFHCHTLKLLYS